MLNDFGFPPDGARARALDLRMRRTLGDSLLHIGEQAAGQLEFDADALRRLAASLRSGARLPPSTFGLYAELVPALVDGRLDEAAALLGSLADERALDTALRVLPLDHPGLEPHAERHARLMGCGPGGDFRFLSPPVERVERFAGELAPALALMRAAAPELADEFDAVVSELVMVGGQPGAEILFDGGSCYMLWGALFLNIDAARDPVALVEVLAHESAHMLLYAFASEEALVLNEDDELFPSPLRVDPRPMDGIYHATYVSARMHWAMSRLLDSGMLDADARALAEAACRDDLRNFAAGDEVVARHGRLTATGEALIRAARDYVRSVGSL